MYRMQEKHQQKVKVTQQLAGAELLGNNSISIIGIDTHRK